MRRSVVAGTGRYLPERIVTNAELAERIDTSDEFASAAASHSATSRRMVSLHLILRPTRPAMR